MFKYDIMIQAYMNKTTKTVLFASLVMAMLLPFSLTQTADAEVTEDDQKMDKEKSCKKGGGGSYNSENRESEGSYQEPDTPTHA